MKLPKRLIPIQPYFIIHLILGNAIFPLGTPNNLRLCRPVQTQQDQKWHNSNQKTKGKPSANIKTTKTTKQQDTYQKQRYASCVVCFGCHLSWQIRSRTPAKKTSFSAPSAKRQAGVARLAPGRRPTQSRPRSCRSAPTWQPTSDTRAVATWPGGPYKRKMIFQVSSHRCYVSGREGSFVGSGTSFCKDSREPRGKPLSHCWGSPEKGQTQNNGRCPIFQD